MIKIGKLGNDRVSHSSAGLRPVFLWSTGRAESAYVQLGMQIYMKFCSVDGGPDCFS